MSFLLSEGMEFTLTEHFCLDPLEKYFGNQTKIEGGPEMQIYFNSDTMTTLHASNAMFHILQAIRMVGMIGSIAGKISLMMLFHNVNLKARH